MVRTTGSTVIDHPIDVIWAIIRDFSSNPKWSPQIESCVMEGGGPSDQVGAVKLIGLPNGAIVRERLTGLSDENHLLTYRIEEVTDLGASKAAAGALGCVEMRTVTDSNATFIEWSHELDVIEGDPAGIIAFYNSLYPVFFNDIRAYATKMAGAVSA